MVQQTLQSIRNRCWMVSSLTRIKRVSDTNAMPWQPHFGIDGAQVKVLATDANGEPAVFISFIPEGARVDTQRLVHPGVHERILVLFGEVTVREYVGHEDFMGVPITVAAGYWLDHPAGVPHGFADPFTTPVGRRVAHLSERARGRYRVRGEFC